MAEVNKRQAFVIEGADVLPNDRGTAPGQWLEESGAVMLLPGPPHELKSMFERNACRASRIVPKQAIRTVFCAWPAWGIDLDQLISPVYKKYENPVTTILAANGDIQIHLRARCATEAEAEALFWRRWAAPSSIAARRPHLLAQRRPARSGGGQLLRDRRATVSVAESCTGGMLGERFTSVPAARTTSWAASSPTTTP
jgi:nicotinamide-nucleotide amidase